MTDQPTPETASPETSTASSCPPELAGRLTAFLAPRLDDAPRQINGARRAGGYELEMTFSSGQVTFLSYPGPLPHGLPERFKWSLSQDQQRQIIAGGEGRYSRQPQGQLGMALIIAAGLGAMWIMSVMNTPPRSALDDLNSEQTAQIVNWAETQTRDWRPLWAPGQISLDWAQAPETACPLNTARQDGRTNQLLAQVWIPVESVPTSPGCKGVSDVLSRAETINRLAPGVPEPFTDAQARAVLDSTLSRREEQGLMRMQDPEQTVVLPGSWRDARQTLTARGLSVPDLH